MHGIITAFRARNKKEAGHECIIFFVEMKSNLQAAASTCETSPIFVNFCQFGIEFLCPDLQPFPYTEQKRPYS